MRPPTNVKLQLTFMLIVAACNGACGRGENNSQRAAISAPTPGCLSDADQAWQLAHLSDSSTEVDDEFVFYDPIQFLTGVNQFGGRNQFPVNAYCETSSECGPGYECLGIIPTCTPTTNGLQAVAQPLRTDTLAEIDAVYDPNSTLDLTSFYAVVDQNLPTDVAVALLMQQSASEAAPYPPECGPPPSNGHWSKPIANVQMNQLFPYYCPFASAAACESDAGTVCLLRDGTERLLSATASVGGETHEVKRVDRLPTLLGFATQTATQIDAYVLSACVNGVQHVVHAPSIFKSAGSPFSSPVSIEAQLQVPDAVALAAGVDVSEMLNFDSLVDLSINGPRIVESVACNDGTTSSYVSPTIVEPSEKMDGQQADLNEWFNWLVSEGDNWVPIASLSAQFSDPNY